MTDKVLDFTPTWNSDMGRKAYILNNLALISVGFVLGVLLGVMLENSQDMLSVFFLVSLVVYTIFAVVVSLIWTNNRLRDSGLASEGWRVFLIILSILSGIVGCIVLLYCSVKPTEHPSELTVEDDDDCRDEGPR
jgi:uncharacterized membrane protein YhaH (DUF805 family)